MDINSIINPSPNPSPSASRRPAGGKRTTSTLSNEISMTSPPPSSHRSAPSLGQESIVQAQRTVFAPAYTTNAAHDVRTPAGNLNTPTSDARSPYGAPQAQRPSLQYASHRSPSTPQMETLADLASMQHHQVQRQNSFAGEHLSPGLNRRTSFAPPINRSLSGLSSTHLAMAEAPAQTPPPRTITSSSLTDDEVQTITGLVQYLSENSYAYDSHVQLINLLHKGFVAHVYGTFSEPINNARDYSLLADMRQARDAMDSRFAVGEAIWKDWINDEALLARTSEDRISVMELCQKAVAEEPTSVDLWSIYGDWMMQTYTVANRIADGDPNIWTDMDKEICKEFFTREIVMDVLERAVEATKWRIDESHRIWDRYIDLVLQEFPDNPSPKMIEHINTLFMMRLQIPQANWDETSRKFWPIVSKHNANEWEVIMAATNESAGPAKQQFGLREAHELTIRKSLDSGDSAALYKAFTDYLNWERKNKRHSPFDLELRCALFERALLHFPTIIEWWLDYADYLLQVNPHSPAVLAIMERATRHCPWSGDLWSRRILRSEVEKKAYEEVENVKHKATNSGLLAIGGMEEVLKVYSSWCGYLRRRAFAPDMTDDELDMADMGITGTLEDASVAGKNIYGKNYKGDPLFRLEKIRVKFLLEARRYADARSVYDRLVPTHAASAAFWLEFYHTEIIVWAHERMSDRVRVETPDSAPVRATAVLRKALSQRDLDWPEKILEVWQNHFNQNETPEALQQAQVEARTAQYWLTLRRTKEAEAAAAANAAAAPPSQQAQPEIISEEASTTGKRKREEGSERAGEDAVKRNKTAEEGPTLPTNTEASSSASAQIKRDREHNTITIKNLPANITEKRIRQFFSDCGPILSVAILADDNSATAHATIEFETHEDVLSAKTRDGKPLDGNDIRIQSGTLSTLYVTNYPADWDEVKIRELFEDFGTIISVRLPSLKINHRRRFCYVQFLTAEEARAATALNEKAIDGQHRLVALISDPDAKKNRSGAATEGRELHVGNIDFAVTEQEIRQTFAQHGTVENVRMLKNAGGKPTGTAFVVFSKAEEANAALVLHNKPIRSRLIRVTIATDKASKGTATKIIHDTAAGSPASDGTPDGQGTDGRRGSATSNPAEGGVSRETPSSINERKLSVLNIPDTVNDARIQSLLETYGPLRKITVFHDKGGAMVEFVNLKDAGTVGMGIDCSSLGPDVRIGTVEELFSRKGSKPAASQTQKPATSLRPAQAAMSRPAQRGGPARRGGLGLKRGGLGSGASKPVEGEDKIMGGTSEGETKVKKSNSDFRNLFIKSKEEPAPAADGNGEGV